MKDGCDGVSSNSLRHALLQSGHAVLVGMVTAIRTRSSKKIDGEKNCVVGNMGPRPKSYCQG